MKILLVGGSGHVGTFVTPYLEKGHTLPVLDLNAPWHASVEYIRGSITIQRTPSERSMASIRSSTW